MKDRIDNLHHELKALRNEFNRLKAVVDTPREHEAGVSPQQHPSEKDNATQRGPALAPKVEPPSRDPRKPWYKTLQGWKVRLEVIAIPFAIVYAVVTCLQWRDLRQNFEAEQRAWVGAVFPWPDLVGDKALEMRPRFTNVGKSVISHLEVESTMEILDVHDEPSFDLGKFHSTAEMPPLFPSVEAFADTFFRDRETGDQRPFTANELRALGEGKMYLVAFGYLRYWDQFGAHWYRFCSWQPYINHVLIGVNARSCVEFNLAGDGNGKYPFVGGQKGGGAYH
jgi:hypothetical protein